MDDTTELQRRAVTGDPLAQFDLNLRQHGTMNVTSEQLAVLKLRPAERRVKPQLARDMRLVDTALVEKFRNLVSGKLRWPLYLYGPSGVGKTRAVLCLADFADSASYHTAEELADVAMGQDARAEWERITSKELAIVDEIGERQKVGDLAYTTLKRFADIREESHNGVAIFSSNCTPGELHKLFDDRIASRLLCGTVFHLTGKDRRFAQ